MAYSFKEYIVWIQTDTDVVEDILNVDGKSLVGKDRMPAFDYILPTSNTGCWKAWKANPQTLEDEGASPSLKVYTNQYRDILISSHFQTRDNKGRKTAFLFCAHRTNVHAECDILASISQSLGYELNECDLSFIKEHLKIKQNKPITSPIIASVSGIIVIITLLILAITCHKI